MNRLTSNPVFFVYW